MPWVLGLYDKTYPRSFPWGQIRLIDLQPIVLQANAHQLIYLLSRMYATIPTPSNMIPQTSSQFCWIAYWYTTKKTTPINNKMTPKYLRNAFMYFIFCILQNSFAKLLLFFQNHKLGAYFVQNQRFGCRVSTTLPIFAPLLPICATGISTPSKLRIRKLSYTRWVCPPTMTSISRVFAANYT